MKPLNYLFVLFLSVLLFSCNPIKLKTFEANNSLLRYSGRVEKLTGETVLIGAASSVSMKFTGDTCVVSLKNLNTNGLHNYISFELDGEDLGRTRLESDSLHVIPIAVDFEKETHVLRVFKSTESQIGQIAFRGVKCEALVELPPMHEKSIEFIGNSITCGMGNDTTDIPCNTNQWYDQHNAYWAYGPIIGRTLDVNYMLSSVSGIGIYRNWNVEGGPTMPMVYENMYLDTNDSKKWDFSVFTPDIVSICLGTNDYSDGDGTHERQAFKADEFIKNYIEFIETIFAHYPETQVALLSSPMLNGEKDVVLQKCLVEIKEHFNASEHKPIALFSFDGIIPHGCDYHPLIEDHMMMAAQLIPFYQDLLLEE
ncbi:MAG: hypothetical protein K9H26_06700 [Prolixibacteraceae bacterium]|nr:hypothetical protein [Prolixibacteraceae bacterium]